MLANHLVANNLFSIAQSTWDKLDASQQAKVQECAIKYRDAWEAIVSEQDSSLRSFLKMKGLRFTTQTEKLSGRMFSKNIWSQNMRTIGQKVWLKKLTL